MTDLRGWNQPEVIGARRIILETALSVLAGKVSPIEGARLIASTRFTARLEDDPDVLPFVGIASETETLPLGDDRIHWQAQALTSLQPDIDKAQTWARDFVSAYCQNLLARAGSLLQWPSASSE
jgi:hypothetical protein